MSTLLEQIFEDEDVQNYVDGSAEQIEEAAGIFHEMPQQVKDYIMENLQDFVVPGDLNATYVKMVDFTENVVANSLNDLCDAIVGE